MKNLSIGPNIFFGKEVNFLKIDPGHMPERLPC